MHGELQQTVEALSRAGCPEDVFGDLGGTNGRQEDALKARFRALARAVHPDRWPDPADAPAAAEAFRLLEDWRKAAEGAIGAGDYGKRRRPAARTTGPTPPPSVTLRVRDVEYQTVAPLGSGDIADVYRAVRRANGAELAVALKVVRNSADNDLMEREASAMQRLWPKGQADDGIFRLLPKLVETFRIRDAGGERRVNAISLYEAEASIADILAAPPPGFDFRDMAWILKRCLSALGLAHRNGVVHGAISPDHILVAADHGVNIIDWTCAVCAGAASSHVPAVYGPSEAFCAPEISAKAPATPATDIYMLAKCMVALLGGEARSGTMPSTVPLPIRAFINACLLDSPARRPHDAWALHDDFEELLDRRMRIPREFRVLRVRSR